MTQLLPADLLEPILEDPFPIYRFLRESAPVCRVEVLDVWAVSCYEDVSRVLNDSAFSADRRRWSNAGVSSKRLLASGRGMLGIGRQYSQSIESSDPPDHTRLRSSISWAFAPRNIATLQSRLEDLADELVLGMIDCESEAMSTLAYVFTTRAIGLFLGLPLEHEERLVDWTAALARGLDPVIDEVSYERAVEAQDQLRVFLEETFAVRSETPGCDVISQLLTQRQGVLASEKELQKLVGFTLLAGYETEANLIGGIIHALATEPDLLERLRKLDVSLDVAVDELLRFYGPLQLTARVARQPVTLHGQEIREGELVAALLPSANRDSARFRHPDDLVLDRKPNPHLAFGSGIHFCLGARLARLETKALLRAIIRHVRGIELVAAPVFRRTVVMRGYEALTVKASGRH